MQVYLIFTVILFQFQVIFLEFRVLSLINFSFQMLVLELISFFFLHTSPEGGGGASLKMVYSRHKTSKKINVINRKSKDISALILFLNKRI